jgi:hypothetical protein
MTMLDDDVLTSLFAQAGATIAVPETGPAVILERAFPVVDRGEGDTDGDDEGEGPASETSGAGDSVAAARARRLVRTMRAHRLLAAAACSVLAVGLITGVGALASGPGKTKVPQSGLAAPSLGAGAPHAARGGVAASSAPSVGGSASTGVGFGIGTTATTATPGASGQAASPTSPAVPSATSTAGTTGSPNGANSALGQSALIEQTGSLTLTVARGAFAKTMSELTFLADADGGFVASSQTQGGSGQAATGIVTLQVPVANFSSMLKKAQSLGRTDDLSTKALDVTGQDANLLAQISALQASRQQYLTIMTRATTIGDILSVQSQLQSIETQIQQLESQLQVLTSETTYSTLTVMVSERTPVVHHVVHHRSHPSGLDNAWHDSVRGFVDGIEGLIKLAGPVLFVLLCAGAVLFGGRAGWRRYQRHTL